MPIFGSGRNKGGTGRARVGQSNEGTMNTDRTVYQPPTPVSVRDALINRTNQLDWALQDTWGRRRGDSARGPQATTAPHPGFTPVPDDDQNEEVKKN